MFFGHLPTLTTMTAICHFIASSLNSPPPDGKEFSVVRAPQQVHVRIRRF
jgi:hypothetical protein